MLRVPTFQIYKYFKLINFVNSANYEIKYNDLIEIINKTMKYCKTKFIGNVSENLQQFSDPFNETTQLHN